jgi:hypothetical protein
MLTLVFNVKLIENFEQWGRQCAVSMDAIRLRLSNRGVVLPLMHTSH